VKRQVPFTVAYPGSEASIAIDRIAKQFLEIPQNTAINGGVKGFLHKMFRLSR
jgi:flagellar biosynthesis protein FlhG